MQEKIPKASKESHGPKMMTENLRLHDGFSGPLAFPEAAPLVFPELDWIANHGTQEQIKKIGKYLRFRKFAADYYDRRAQAEYVSIRPPWNDEFILTSNPQATKNPDSPLASPPQRGFTSRFGDPSDSTNLSPFSLATGGLVPYSTKGYFDRTRGRRQAANVSLPRQDTKQS